MLAVVVTWAMPATVGGGVVTLLSELVAFLAVVAVVTLFAVVAVGAATAEEAVVPAAVVEVDSNVVDVSAEDVSVVAD